MGVPDIPTEVMTAIERAQDEIRDRLRERFGEDVDVEFCLDPIGGAVYGWVPGSVFIDDKRQLDIGVVRDSTVRDFLSNNVRFRFE